VRLEIGLMGEVTVRAPGRPPPPPLTGPARAVLAALVLERPAPVPRDRLAEVLWADDLPRTWASALRTHVSRVRSGVAAAVPGGGETVVAGDGGYVLALPGEVVLDVDVERAERALAEAREALMAGDAGAARAAAATAVDLLGAPFLPGHGGPWADEVRARLDHQAVLGLELASQAAAAAGDPAAGLEAAEEAVRRAPLRESAHRALIAALDRSGDRAEALRAYQRLRRSLADELGVDPSPETEAAYLALLGPPTARRAGPRDPPAAGGAATGPAPVSPFVGREAELAVLADAWDRAASGARHLVVVTGEAGIGKSRLTSEAARRVATEGGRVLFGRCDREAIVPYQPVVEALDAYVAATPPDELPPLDDESLAELAAVLPSLAAPRRAVAPDGRARLFGAVTDLVAAAAKERPLLVVLDDLQWADDDTLLLLRHLLRRAGHAPVLVVAISRDHDVDPGRALGDVVHALDRDGWVRRLPLRGLAEADVRELLALTGDGADAAERAAVARRLVAETAGNPFLLTELLRSGLATAPGEATIPPGVQDLVAARLAGLDAGATELVRTAAVAGSRFDLDVVAEASHLDGPAVLDALDAALASGLVGEVSPDHYEFIHDIVRRTLVEGMSGARRRAVHGRLAAAIERLRAHALDAHAAVLAHHSSEGAGPAGDVRAVRWAREASAQAARRSAPAEAVRLSRQALAHVPPGDGPLRAEVTTELGATLLAAGDQAGAGTLVDGAALARDHGRPDVVGRAALALADAAESRPDLREPARRLVDAAVAAAAAGTDPDRLRYARLLARQVALGGPGGAGAAASRRGVPLAALQALHDRIEALDAPHHVEERRHLAGELAVLAGAAGDPTFRVLAAHEQAMAAATLGDDDGVREALAVLEAPATAGTDPFAAAMLAERTVTVLTAGGHFAEALSALPAAVAAHRALAGPEAGAAVAARHRTLIARLWAGAPPGEIEPDPAWWPDGAGTLHDLGLAAMAAGASGDADRIARARARLAPYADLVCGLGYRSFVGVAAFHLGRLAAAAGDGAEAERHLQAALRRHSAWRARPWVALTQTALADVLESRGRTSDREWIDGLRREADWVTDTLALRRL
jgi:DNA-binding SARP family transcriptional activator